MADATSSSSRVSRRTAYLGLGSNLGDREANLRRAVELLAPHRTSSIYETEPMYVADQPWFLNMVVELETAFAPEELMNRCRAIEEEMGGRERPLAKGPRTIDIDLLLYDDVVIESGELTLPHPGIAERRFVLEPLVELAPDLTLPGTDTPVRILLGRVRGQGVRRMRPYNR